MADNNISRDTVFTAGGQPSVTYVDRTELDIERQLARAIAAPNQIVSLSGPTKAGKTVLCREVLDDRQYIWIEGGQINTTFEVWDKICYELNYPTEITKSSSAQTQIGIAGGLANFILSASGSQIYSKETKRSYKIDSMETALRCLIENNIYLIIDDFHYMNDESRTEFLRNIKGGVFMGLKVILLSVTHRAFDAIKAETELTGRFAANNVPEWNQTDLIAISQKGFSALNMNCSQKIMTKLAYEAQNSPFLMQRFCWEICFDLNVDLPPDTPVRVPSDVDLNTLFIRIAKDSGLPIYERLVAGPQSRKERLKRPLKFGGDADVYEATLLAIAETGPVPSLSYDELRSSLNSILVDKVPQKHEVTSALKHLSRISRDIGTDVGLDWDDEKRHLNITDPYLRFYLRWQVRRTRNERELLLQ